MQFSGEILWNISLVILCYAYISLVTFVSSRSGLLHLSRKTSRKFLHMMIGNLPFIIPFFTIAFYPVLVAAPFVLITLCASPYSPLPSVSKRLAGLSVLTEEGHKLGLVFYAISYSVLAFVFSDRPFIIAAGILPMAYGDAAASVIGEKHGRRRYRVFANKSLEGTLAMFLISFLSLSIGLVFFSILYSFPFFDALLAVLAASFVATFAESVSPLGLDNLTVPLSSALAFIALSGGF